VYKANHNLSNVFVRFAFVAFNNVSQFGILILNMLSRLKSKAHLHIGCIPVHLSIMNYETVRKRMYRTLHIARADEHHCSTGFARSDFDIKRDFNSCISTHSFDQTLNRENYQIAQLASVASRTSHRHVYHYLINSRYSETSSQSYEAMLALPKKTSLLVRVIVRKAS
jgi:hypothetical protein